MNIAIVDKLLFDDIDEHKLTSLKNPSYSNLLKIAIENSDAIIKATDKLPKTLEAYIDTLDKPVLEYLDPEKFENAYLDFYRTLFLNNK